MRKSTLPPPTANELTRAILEYLRFMRAHAWRQNAGTAMLPGRGGKPMPVRFGPTGCGDVLALVQGTFLSIEVKVGRDKLRPSQLAWMDSVRRAGGVCIVARSVQDVMDEVEKIR